MAESTNNVILNGLSGMLGGQIVFRQRAGKTVVANRPKKSSVPPSKDQEETRVDFGQANKYAVAAMKDPATKAIYEAKTKPGQSAFNVAMADFLRLPIISKVDVSSYTGEPGDVITMRVTDDVLVKEVLVTIENADGSLLEKGDAVLQSNGLDYQYTATQTNKQVAGSKIIITATGLPGNMADSTTVL